jgi:hypothetical protein
MVEARTVTVFEDGDTNSFPAMAELMAGIRSAFMWSLWGLFRRLNEPMLNSLRAAPMLCPDPIAFCVGIVTIVTALDATTPTHTWFRIDILSAVQPADVFRALHGVYARFVDGVRVARHSHEHVISVG